jgi:O-antigen/teichoic acid export membrane protein
MKEKMLSREIENVMLKTRSGGLSLRVNFSWTLAGNIIYAGCQWGMLIVIAKLGTPELVGQFALGYAISAPIMMFTNLNLRIMQATDARGEYPFNYYLGLRLITIFLALLLIAGIFLFFNIAWDTKLIIMIIGVAKAVESLSDIFFGLMQKYEQMDRIGISFIIKGILSLLALSLGLYLGGSLLLGVILMACAWLSIFLFYDIRNALIILEGADHTNKLIDVKMVSRYTIMKPDFNSKILKRLAWIAFPLGIVDLLNSFNVNLPRYFIGYFLGERELGIFAAISYSLFAGFTVIQALGQSASPRLAQYFVTGKLRSFCKLIFGLLSFTVGLGLVGILLIWGLGREFLSLVYKPEYALNQDLFLLLAVGAIFASLATFLRMGMTAARYFRIQMPIYILSIVVSALTCYFLIPRYGLIASGWSKVISFLVETCCCGLVLWYILRLTPKPQKN